MKHQILALGMPTNLITPIQKQIGMSASTSERNTLVIKHLPPINQKNLRDSLYSIFLCSYSYWQKFAKFIANGQYQNIFEDGKTPSPETRMYWITRMEGESEIWLKTLTNNQANDYSLQPGESVRVALSFNDMVKKIAYHEQCRNLGPEHATQKKYNGYICAVKADIYKVQQNCRNFVKFNPEYSLIFTELSVYTGVYNHSLTPINKD